MVVITPAKLQAARIEYEVETCAFHMVVEYDAKMLIAIEPYSMLGFAIVIREQQM